MVVIENLLQQFDGDARKRALKNGEDDLDDDEEDSHAKRRKLSSTSERRNNKNFKIKSNDSDSDEDSNEDADSDENDSDAEPEELSKDDPPVTFCVIVPGWKEAHATMFHKLVKSRFNLLRKYAYSE